MRVLGLRWLPVVGIGNLLATVIFAMAAIYLVAAQPTRGGLWAYVVVLAAVLPLLILRRHPVLAPWAKNELSWRLRCATSG